ncbi:MAG: hypothetical protein QM497_02440 [Sulfurimonas sp.]
MVKIFLSFLLLVTLGYSNEKLVLEEDLLAQKIQSFVGENAYEKKINFINVIFEPKSAFYKNERVDVLKVVQTLEENGLLKLFFKKPQEIRLNFKTSGSPLFFVKLMGDSLRNIGYYRYVTTASKLNPSEFIWNISMTSEYATDPLVLQTELAKSGCYITDITRESPTDWTYVIDMSAGFLNLLELQHSKEVKLKRSLYAHWLDCSMIQKLKIRSSRRNNWYPQISYYDSSLHLLEVSKIDEKRRLVTLDIPKRAKYMKISDLYTLKNVKDELVLSPYGRR